MNDKTNHLAAPKDFALPSVQSDDKVAQLAATRNPENLLALAVEKGADIGTLERLMDLKERHDAQLAREEFFAAVAKFQSICPVIPKDKVVDYTPRSGQGRVYYQYASLPKIIETIRPALKKCGLSYRFEQKMGQKLANEGAEASEVLTVVTVTCILTHVRGHSERTTLTSSADTSGSKNAIQAIGSANSFLQRYTLIGMLGLTTADSDDDGDATEGQGTPPAQAQSGSPAPRSAPDSNPDRKASVKQVALIRKKLEFSKKDEAEFCHSFGIDSIEALPFGQVDDAIAWATQ